MNARVCTWAIIVTIAHNDDGNNRCAKLYLPEPGPLHISYMHGDVVSLRAVTLSVCVCVAAAVPRGASVIITFVNIANNCVRALSLSLSL